MVLRIIADDRQRIGRRHVPAGGKIRRRPLGRNAERDRDLADVGGKAGAATHNKNIPRRPEGELAQQANLLETSPVGPLVNVGPEA